MLRSLAASVLSAALLFLSTSAFRQALSEFRDTEPGSLLFGVLQLVIGTSAVAAAIGLLKRARWAAWPVASWGIATAALLAVQPLFEPMPSDATRAIWSAAGAVGVVAAGLSWFARRQAAGRGDSPASNGQAGVLPPPAAEPGSGVRRSRAPSKREG